MTIKQLLGLDVEVLEAMTPEVLQQHCAPYLRIVEISKKPTEEGDSNSSEDGGGKLDLEAKERQRRGPRVAKKGETWQREAERLAARYGVEIVLPKELKK